MTDLALLTTVYRPESHTDVILARWLESIPADPRWGWNGPRSSIVSAYVARFPDNDLARERLGDAGIPLHGSIAAALRIALALRSGSLFPAPNLPGLGYTPAVTPVGVDDRNLNRPRAAESSCSGNTSEATRSTTLRGAPWSSCPPRPSSSTACTCRSAPTPRS